MLFIIFIEEEIHLLTYGTYYGEENCSSVPKEWDWSYNMSNSSITISQNMNREMLHKIDTTAVKHQAGGTKKDTFLRRFTAQIMCVSEQINKRQK